MFWEPTKFNLLSSRSPPHYKDAEMGKEQLITGLIMICSASGQKKKEKGKLKISRCTGKSLAFVYNRIVDHNYA